MNETYDNGQHTSVEQLLPWYVNGTLRPKEHAQVRRHLESCEECRRGVELLARMQSAVKHPEASPIVPAPRPETLLEAIGGRAPRGRRLRVAGALAGTAMLAIGTFVAGIVVSGRDDSSPDPALYRTLTSEPGPAAMDYVLDLHFESGLTPADRDRVLHSLAATQVSSGTPGGWYRVTVSLPAASLQEVEQFTRRIESMPEVRSARVVAMQLPMQPRK
jgi:hypothetical protein